MCCVLCACTRVCVWCVSVCVVLSCIGVGLLCSQECKCKLFSMSTHTPIHCVPYRVQQMTCFGLLAMTEQPSSLWSHYGKTGVNVNGNVHRDVVTECDTLFTAHR